MRRKLTLYIGNLVADTESAELVLYNYVREELGDPAVVRSSYSRQVTLPSTPGNDTIFDGFFRHDYSRFDQLSFDPLRKEPFTIYDEASQVLERGYLELDSVAYKGREVHSYTVTLYGGLNGFFYGLKYREDGTQKTLADLVYYDYRGTAFDPRQEQFQASATVVREAWEHLADDDLSRVDGLYGIVNFMPAYNGLPACRFDADKAVFKQGIGAENVPNLYTSKTVDDVTYGTRADADGHILLKLGSKHTDIETQDWRAYLQRPVIRVLAILDALTHAVNTAGYTFRMDGSVLFNEDYDYFMKTWITLPMFDRDNLDPMSCGLDDLLEDTDSPADYLIGYAKLFGCVFLFDASTNTVTMMSRDAFYWNPDLPVVDLSGRVDLGQEHSVDPFALEHRYYSFDLDTYGEFAAAYEERYGRRYGSFLVDTGYEFDKETKRVFEGVVYRGAADVVELSPFFRAFGGTQDPQYGTSVNYDNKFAILEAVSWDLYGADAEGEEVVLSCEPTPEPYLLPFRYDTTGNSQRDWMPRVQLHGADNKAEAGSNVLVFFNRMASTPVYRSGSFVLGEVEIRLTDDSEAMLALNDGVPCWDLTAYTTGDSAPLGSVPEFRRLRTYFISGVEYDGDNLDFGVPREMAAQPTPDDEHTMYANWWERYIVDRYNAESRVLTAWVDLGGLQVDDSLLRRYFWFDGCLWSLNRVIDHSLTTLDLTRCEFVRVQNTDNYDSGQLEI